MAHDIIRLNVGGIPYTTTKATLSKYPNSMIGAMFNGSMSTTVDDDGRYFIDRDGEMFAHVLNFLRSSRLALPDGFKCFDQLAVEADFYQIEPLIQAVSELRKEPEPKSYCRFLEVLEVRTGSTATMPTNNSRIKTIISGRRDIINSLPSHLIGAVERLRGRDFESYTELELVGSNIRLRLAEYLLSGGWTLMDSSLSSSSGYDSKSMISTLLIEHTYRDKWLLKLEGEPQVSPAASFNNVESMIQS